MHWRTHPGLTGKIHPEHPDDLQVLIHDGGPRLSQLQPEGVWVSITSLVDNVFTGRVLNAPTHLKTVQQNQMISFRVDTGTEYAVMLTAKYLEEKPDWKITPCSNCGFTELFDAPSDLLKATFPNMPDDAELEGFTARCPLCGGVQSLESKAALKANRPWWKFWAGN